MVAVNPLSAGPLQVFLRRARLVCSVSSSSRCRGLLLIACLAGVIAGCGGQTGGEVSQVQSNLGWLGSKYAMFVGSHRGRAPKNIDEFRQYVEKKTTSQELERLKVKSVDELFISPRDGKPVKMITYSKLPAFVGGQPPPVVFHEEAGKDGKLTIVYLGGNTQTVDAADLQTLLPVGGR
jgi:hypothetical protein